MLTGLPTSCAPSRYPQKPINLDRIVSVKIFEHMSNRRSLLLRARETKPRLRRLFRTPGLDVFSPAQKAPLRWLQCNEYHRTLRLYRYYNIRDCTRDRGPRSETLKQFMLLRVVKQSCEPISGGRNDPASLFSKELPASCRILRRWAASVSQENAGCCPNRWLGNTLPSLGGTYK